MLNILPQDGLLGLELGKSRRGGRGQGLPFMSRELGALNYSDEPGDWE